MIRHALIVVGLLGSLTSAAVADEGDRCALAGLRLGGAFPGDLKPNQYKGDSTKFLEGLPAGTYVYRLLKGSPGTEDFVAVREGKVLRVVREFSVERVNTFMSALLEKYGDPVPVDSSEGRQLGAFATLKDRVTWIVPECSASVELVRRTRMRGALVTQKAAIVLAPHAAGDASLRD